MIKIIKLQDKYNYRVNLDDVSYYVLKGNIMIFSLKNGRVLEVEYRDYEFAEKDLYIIDRLLLNFKDSDNYSNIEIKEVL